MAPTTTATPGVSFDPDGKKRFIPLENNPEVFSGLVKALGLSDKLSFYDVYSVDEPDLLALVPRPVHALIFIAPAPVYHLIRANDRSSGVGGTEERRDPGSGEKKPLTYDGSGADEPVVWFRQTIGHACGLIALLHSVSNGTARGHIVPGSYLDRMLAEAEPLKPEARAAVLYNSTELEQKHMAAAVGGQSVVPESQEPNGHHFIAFVRSPRDGHMWELEGSSDGPIDRGLLEGDGDLLGDEALDRTVRKYIALADGNLEFSIVALASNPS